MATQRTYKINLERQRGSMTGEQIAQSKNSRCKERAKARSQVIQEQIAAKPKLSAFDQLQRLDWRLGRDKGAVKERKRLVEKIYNEGV